MYKPSLPPTTPAAAATRRSDGRAGAAHASRHGRRRRPSSSRARSSPAGHRRGPHVPPSARQPRRRRVHSAPVGVPTTSERLVEMPRHRQPRSGRSGVPVPAGAHGRPRDRGRPGAPAQTTEPPPLGLRIQSAAEARRRRQPASWLLRTRCDQHQQLRHSGRVSMEPACAAASPTHMKPATR